MSVSKKRKPVIDLFIQKDKVALFWFLFAIVATAGFWSERQKLIRIYQKKPQFFVMDANSTYYLPAAIDFEDAKQVHAAQTRLAMEAVFNRNPSGPDNPDRLKRILGLKLYQETTKRLEEETKAFRAKEIHQKIELGAIQILQVRDDSVLTAVEGQLIRNGVFRNKPFTEVLEVSAQFKFILNPDMRHNGRFPTVAIAFDYNTRTTTKS
jgi:hypothetical protein